MLNVAVIGTGGLGSRHVLNFAHAPGCQVKRVFDLNRAAAEAAAQPVEAEVADAPEPCFAGDIDLVVVVTPDSAHLDYCLRACAAGKHIFCEKPLVRDLAEAEQLVEAVSRAGIKMMVGHVVRYFPAYRLAHETLRAGQIGQVGMARMLRINTLPPQPWYRDYAQSGGVLHDLCIHDLDWLLWTFGMPVRLFARNLRSRLPVLDYGLAELRFAGGEIAHVEGSFADVAGFRTSFDIAGSGGLLQHDSTRPAPLTFQARAAGPAGAQYLPSASAQKSPYQHQVDLFVEAVRSDTSPPVTVEDGYRAVRVSLACLESAETGRVIRFS